MFQLSSDKFIRNPMRRVQLWAFVCVRDELGNNKFISVLSIESATIVFQSCGSLYKYVR